MWKVNQMRYKLYREHKYISAVINDVVRLMATTDFTVPSAVARVKTDLQALWPILAWHSLYEDEILHPMLAEKGVYLYAQVEAEHAENKQKIVALENQLSTIMTSTNRTEQIAFGYQLYLSFRKFSAENLMHLDAEETLLLPEFYRLYSDDELRVAEFQVYQVMSNEQMIKTINKIFPYMNPSDRETFLYDAKFCDQARFTALWQGVEAHLDPAEREMLKQKLY